MADEPLVKVREPEEPLFSAAEAGAQLRIPAPTIGRMRRSGILKAYYIGSSGSGVRYRLSEILDAIRQKPVAVKKKEAVKKTATTGKQKG